MKFHVVLAVAVVFFLPTSRAMAAPPAVNEAGTAPYPPLLAGRIRAALEKRPAGYRPRSVHVDEAGAPVGIAVLDED